MNNLRPLGLVSFLLAACLTVSPVVAAEQSKLERLTSLTVYKTPTCGCCGKWVAHIEEAGFDVTVREMNDLSSVKRSAGIDARHQSCHTAISDEGDYVFEGHIPAKFIEAFLADTPAGARGLVVPAMPVGSPGMEYEDRFSPYDVLLLTADGDYEVYAHVGKPQDAGHH
jgi:hypothetical protein